MGTKHVDQMVSGVAATFDDTWTGDMLWLLRKRAREERSGEKRKEEAEDSPAIFRQPPHPTQVRWLQDDGSPLCSLSERGLQR